MKITFVSNYINHHQIPVSDALYKLTNGDYTFIQTEPMEEERVAMGWDASAMNKPYVKLFYEEKEACEKLIMDSDCVIFGGTEREELIKPRLNAGKLTIRYSESIYKEGRWKFISPKGLMKKYKDHVKYNKSNVYLLCAGAYVKGDFNLIHAYPKKKLKYGYFPEFIEYADVHEKRTDSETVNVLWAARFIDWKHPEVMVKLAKLIKEEGLNVHISMIGNGELLDKEKESAKYIPDIISFEGAKTPAEVREAMKKADIFIATSDRREGWGAVLNEAMNSGCAVVAPRDMGAAPYLIDNGKNGFLYKACDIDALFYIVKELVASKNLCRLLGTNAYETIKETWNADVAAKRLYEFILDENKDMDRYPGGPLSRA